MNDLTPAQTDAVRRALAAARHDEPIPAEVAARLDATLADLVAEQSMPTVAAAMVAPVIPLRRRRLPVLLAAAAAVVAAAVVTPQFLDRSAQHSSQVTADQADSSTAEGAGNKALAPEAPTTASVDTLGALVSNTGVTHLHDATLGTELANLVHQRALLKTLDAPNALRSDNAFESEGGTAPLRFPATVSACGPFEPPASSSIFVARYHHHHAVVVALRTTADGTPVQIYDCEIAPRVPARLLTVPLAD
jgi:hypothetical protein